MTTRIITILGFVVVFLAAGTLVAASWLRPERHARFTETLRHVTKGRAIRILVLFCWAWLGWHFLAR
ncbi:DUF6186 family protein [Actinopolymorpha alba]|uniref:DUF6186 family protein n=1 Tax=Actinopolymorpha alba TaxID=533267 RepID=UPI000364C58C|nr:DUF6186 family protein [Actinopolymorpha alba]